MLLEIVDELAYHFLGHLIRLNIGLHIGIGFGKKIAEPLQGSQHHADVLFRVGVDVGLEKDEEIDFLLDRGGFVVFPAISTFSLSIRISAARASVSLFCAVPPASGDWAAGTDLKTLWSGCA